MITARQSPSVSTRPDSKRTVFGVCLLLVAAVFLVFGQTYRNGFINYDDDQYVYDNPMVTQGLKLSGIAWAFTTSYSAYWHPLTWLSHMLDCQLWGLNAGDHHLTNVMFHAANALLLFMVLRRMTGLRPGEGAGAAAAPAGTLWPSAFVAALFAIHPLNVESVAWVAERKNVLSTFFWLLTLWAYARYAEKSKFRSPESKVFYGLALGFFALGLMSKPMLVTLPFVLLLLDYWPLRRAARDEWRVTRDKNPGFQPSTKRILRLVLEKVPFLLLAAASSVATYLGQKSVGAMMTFEQIPLGVRLAKVPVNYVIYLRNTIWPEGLAIPYPCPPAYPVFLVALCILLLAGVTLLVLWAAKSKPYAAVGWFWFLGTLVPVIGLVQVGGTPVADRFTYVPQIGLYLAIAWMIRDWTVSWRYRRQALGLAATLVITALMVCAWKQTSYWRNSETLWRRALACTSDNFIGHNNLGNALLKMGRVDEAITQYQKALEIKPDFAEAHNNLGYVQFQKNNVDEGIAHFQKALQINPDYAEAHYNFGYALCQKGRVDEGITHFQRALQIKPDFAEARNNLGSALLQMGSVNEAIAQYQQALQINPDSTTVRHNLDIALRQKSRVDDALAQCQKALQIKPDSVEALNNLAWLLATCPDAHIRDGVQAVKYGERACELTHTNVTVLVGTLAAAYAEAGRYDDAIAAAQKACALAEKSGEQDLLEKNQKLLELYRAHQSYHEAAAKFVPTAPQL